MAFARRLVSLLRSSNAVFLRKPTPPVQWRHLAMSRHFTASACAASNTATAVNTPGSQKMLTLHMRDGVERTFPSVWLRDNCPCSKCYDYNKKMKKTQTWTVNLDVSVKGAEFEDNGNRINIEFNDGHVGQFPHTWLKERSFDSLERALRQRERYGRKKTMWIEGQHDRMETFQFEELMEDGPQMAALVKALDEYGICLVKGAATKRGDTNSLPRLMTLFTPSCYGIADSPATKADFFDLHVNRVYEQNNKGVVLFHGMEIRGVTGAESFLADGFKAAMKMQERHPDLFMFLARHTFDFYKFGVEEGHDIHKINQTPVLRMDANGELEQVMYGVNLRDSIENLELEDADIYYRALSTFHSYMYDKDNFMYHIHKPGEILCIDNRRVLHGRNGFTIAPGGTRQIDAAFLEWDELYSKLRILEQNLQNN